MGAAQRSDRTTESIILITPARSFHTGDTDFSFIIRSVEAIAAQVAIVIIYKTTIGVGELELCPGDQSTGYAVLFLDDQSTGAIL